jgi:hypothetical protein
MKLLSHFIVLFFLPGASFGQIDLVVYDSCSQLQKQAQLNRLPRSDHSRPLVIANGIIVSIDEINEKLIDTIYIIKCPQSFQKFGNIGAHGVIFIGSRQVFNANPIRELARRKEGKKAVYAVNGYLFADPDLRISGKAVKGLKTVHNYQLPGTSELVSCFSIWTITKKEIRNDRAMPKLCRGVVGQ